MHCTAGCPTHTSSLLRCATLQVFTLTVPPEQEAAAEELVRGLAPVARLTYALAGTRKYELPSDQVTLAGARCGARHLFVGMK